MALIETGMERRTSIILLQYWNALRDERPFPQEDEIDPERLDGVWGHCFVLQIRDVKQVKDYNFTYLGNDLLQAYGDGTLDKFNGKMIAPDANRSAHLFDQVIASQDPLLDEGEYINPVGKVVRFRQSFLPLGNPKGEIYSILGGAWYRLFNE